MTKNEAIGILNETQVVYFAPNGKKKVQEALDMAMEALQIDVVKCKDCKYRETDDCPMYWEEWIMFEDCDGYTDNDYIVHDYTTDDGYCDYGERKE